MTYRNEVRILRVFGGSGFRFPLFQVFSCRRRIVLCVVRRKMDGCRFIFVTSMSMNERYKYRVTPVECRVTHGPLGEVDGGIPGKYMRTTP